MTPNDPLARATNLLRDIVDGRAGTVIFVDEARALLDALRVAQEDNQIIASTLARVSTELGTTQAQRDSWRAACHEQLADAARLDWLEAEVRTGPLQIDGLNDITLHTAALCVGNGQRVARCPQRTTLRAAIDAVREMHDHDAAARPAAATGPTP